MNNFKRLLNKVLDAVYPTGVTCLFCGEEMKEKETGTLCNGCKRTLEEIKSPIFAGENAVYTCFLYDGSARKIILQSKDSGKSYLTQVMAEFIWKEISRAELSFDAIAYVPTAEGNAKKRGYDHMRLTAERLSDITHKPVLKGFYRIKEGVDQTKLADDERKSNVKNAFYYSGEHLDGKTILLIDDVVTTGATLDSCAAALNTSNPKRILFATFSAAHRSVIPSR